MKKLLIVLISVCSFQLAIAQCPDFSVGSVMSDAEDSLEDLAAEKISKAVFKKMVGRIAGGLLEPSKLSSDADKPGLYTLKEGTEEYQDAFARLDYRKMKASVKKME